MIPLKLTLHNFMCFRENVPPISFEGLHTACISGNNGNGKSALIDAITWALWGETRADSDDDLVHTGSPEVRVEFEFAVGKQRYRIIRQHSRPKTQRGSGQTLVDFQLVASEGNKTLTGNTTSETQRIITQVLHMDYDTFVNSAFLRQGHADEFTRKPAGERKQVLGSILQLSIYDELEEHSKDLARERELQVLTIESSLTSLREELTQKPGVQSELKEIQSRLDQLEKQLVIKEREVNQLRQQKQNLDNKQNQSAELLKRLNDTRRSLASWQGQAEQIHTRIQHYGAIVLHRQEISDNFKRYMEIHQQLQETEQKFKQWNSFSQTKHRLELVILKAGEELNKAHAVSQRSIDDLAARCHKMTGLQREIQQLDAELKRLDQVEREIQIEKDRLRDLQAGVETLKSENLQQVQLAQQVAEKIDLLEHKSDGACTCPLCETELGEDGRRRILSKYLAEKNSGSAALLKSREEAEAKAIEARSLETQITREEIQYKHSREKVLIQRGKLAAAIADAQECSVKMELEKGQLELIEARLAARDFAQPEQAAMAQIEKDMLSLGYDSQKHDQLKNQVTFDQKWESEKQHLDEAEVQMPVERQAEEKAMNMLQEFKTKLEVDNSTLAALETELTTYQQVASQFAQVEREKDDLSKQLNQFTEQAGGARSRLENLNQKEIQKQEKENQLAVAQKQKEIYKELVQAFGKKGIQAMLIEMVLPELEAEANKLLARMTDNRMNIKMETQRTTRKGDQVETLDINISDELGTRNYEMFSGGEAFRIDFAIRIALAKLLAHRAGAPLPTLIIDEGFGTQDSTGIEKIKEAITSIQDDFEKILVITHIAEFKEAFPSRIEVVKTAEGSTVSLN